VGLNMGKGGKVNGGKRGGLTVGRVNVGEWGE
jgi:hypothetical protein